MEPVIKLPTACVLLGTTIYFVISKLIFDHLYLTSKEVIDEAFHLPLGEAYCHYDFSKWDNKVTTLPGLYLISALFLGPFQLCSTYWLRFVSLGASVVNFILFYVILSGYRPRVWKRNLFTSINLALLPPLYFFSHLYYTDVVSITVMLLVVLTSEKGQHYLASVFGLLAILVRQTNIIYVGLVAGKFVLNEVYASTFYKSNTRGAIEEKRLVDFLLGLKANLWPALKRLPLQFWLNICAYLSLLLGFIVFVILNGSIVVGDKTAHQATVHIPQIFYFALFSLVFALPHFLLQVNSFLGFAKRHIILLITCLVVGMVIVHFNTLVHPYLLADNRHYTFYIWNRFYARYSLFRYAIVFVYVFALFVIIKGLWNINDVSFALMFIPCAFFVLTTQRLIEIRYYLLPFILFRLQLRNVQYHTLIVEFITYCFINALTFNVFFTKTIYWSDFDQPQRIIW